MRMDAKMKMAAFPMCNLYTMNMDMEIRIVIFAEK